MRDKVKWSLTAFAGAAQMHVGPLSRLNEESGELGTDSSHSSVRTAKMCAGQVVVRGIYPWLPM